jgi:hypothetical protein
MQAGTGEKHLCKCVSEVINKCSPGAEIAILEDYSLLKITENIIEILPIFYAFITNICKRKKIPLTKFSFPTLLPQCLHTNLCLTSSFNYQKLPNAHRVYLENFTKSRKISCRVEVFL